MAYQLLNESTDFGDLNFQEAALRKYELADDFETVKLKVDSTGGRNFVCHTTLVVNHNFVSKSPRSTILFSYVRRCNPRLERHCYWCKVRFRRMHRYLAWFLNEQNLTISMQARGKMVEQEQDVPTARIDAPQPLLVKLITGEFIVTTKANEKKK